MASPAVKVVLPLAGTLLLAGCNVGPDFKQPTLWSPSSWFTHQPKPPATLASLPVPQAIDPHWWSVFNDPELTSLESRVAAANLDVRVAAVRLAESREQRAITSADEFPQVNGDAQYQRNRLSPRGEFGLLGGGGSSGGSGSTGAAAGANGVPATTTGLSSVIAQPFNLWQYGFDATWEIDIWGRVRRSIEAADASVEASVENRRNVLLSVLAEVARDYIQLRGTQAQLAISQQNLRTAQDSLRLTQQRAIGGLTTDLDVANAAAQVSATAATIPSLEQQQAQTINQLSFLLGEQPGALQAELITPAPVPPVPPAVPVGLPSELARRRPDIRQAEAQLHSATAQIGVAEANFYPSITLSGNLSLQAIQIKNLANWDSRTYAFGPSINLPIFEGGRLKAQLKLNQAQQQEAAVSFQRTVLNAFHEVDNALIAYQTEQRRRDQLRVSVDQNQRALNLARDRYAQGITDFLQVLTAERSLLSAQQQLTDSTTTVSTNLVQLYKALGGGWEGSFPMQQQAASAVSPPPS